MKCSLYEACKQQGYENHEHNFKTELAEIDVNMGFAQMLNNEKAEVVDTKFGMSPVGSFLSYQTSFTESNFSDEADLTAFPRSNIPVTNITNYPRFPLSNEADMALSRVLTDGEKSLLANLTDDEDKIHAIESGTREQAGCAEWKEESKYQFTASSFQLYYIHFEITSYSCNLIGSQQCDIFPNYTIFCSKSHLFLSQ